MLFLWRTFEQEGACVSDTHPVEEVGATHHSDPADVVHEAEVSLSGAIHLTHLYVPKAAEELPPDVLTQAVPYTHPNLVGLIQFCLTEEGRKGGRDGGREEGRKGYSQLDRPNGLLLVSMIQSHV